MTRRQLIDYCLTYPDSYEDYPFDDRDCPAAWAALRHKTNKKCFAFIYERDNQLIINLKGDPAVADFLRSTYRAVSPAFHLNKTHWSSVLIGGGLPDYELYSMIESSYRLTAPKLKGKH